MSKKDKIYLGIVALITLIYIGYQAFGPQPVDWSPSFSGSDTIPYGAYILDNELDALFPNSEIHRLSIPSLEYLLYTDMNEIPVNWVFINNQINPDPNELGMILERVDAGDHLFISASRPGSVLSDSLGFTVSYRTSLDRELRSTGSDEQRSSDIVRLNLVNPDLKNENGWEYEERQAGYFSGVDSTRTVILGDIEKRANYIRIKHGEGYIYLHLFPLAFTNYYMREEHYAEYAFKALSYLPVQDVIWDEYYKTGRKIYTSPMGYVLSELPLRTAWFLALAGVILFMIFKGRREQRAISEREKPKNSTIEFARTIGSLYLEKGTHKEIAAKKIRFFMDYCRRKLGIEFEVMNPDLAEAIAGRSGVNQKQVEELLLQVREVHHQKEISKTELKKVTSEIDQFYKATAR